jgi:predicted metal-binding membrane protein
MQLIESHKLLALGIVVALSVVLYLYIRRKRTSSPAPGCEAAPSVPKGHSGMAALPTAMPASASDSSASDAMASQVMARLASMQAASASEAPKAAKAPAPVAPAVPQPSEALGMSS